MTQYSQKIIKNLEPEWYRLSSKSERKEIQDRMNEDHKELWENKPESIPGGTVIVAKKSIKNITKGRLYTVFGHFCTLITTIYYSEWNQFVTLKNDNGWTVKMNLNNFEFYNANIHDHKTKRLYVLEQEVEQLKSKVDTKLAPTIESNCGDSSFII
jgi:hypothetical protein